MVGVNYGLLIRGMTWTLYDKYVEINFSGQYISLV